MRCIGKRTIKFRLFIAGALLTGFIVPGCFNAEKMTLRSLDPKPAKAVAAIKTTGMLLQREANVEAGNGPVAVQAETGVAGMQISKVTAGGNYNKQDFQANGGPGNFRMRGGLYGNLP